MKGKILADDYFQGRFLLTFYLVPLGQQFGT